jgi:N-acetylmuramoyl-L-alanine amidase
LTIDGRPVAVERNGAFLAWLPIPIGPNDTLATYHLVASLGAAEARVQRTVRVPRDPEPLPVAYAAIDSGALTPRGAWWVREGELIEVRVRATPGASALLLLSEVDTLSLSELPDSRPVTRASSVSPGLADSAATRGSGTYVGEFTARAPIGLGRLTPSLLPMPADVTDFARLCAPASARSEADTVDMTEVDTTEMNAVPDTGTDERMSGVSALRDSTATVPDFPTSVGASSDPSSAGQTPLPERDCALVEVTLAGDTARLPLPLDLWLLRVPGPLVRLQEELSDAGSDGFVVGRSAPSSTTLWLWTEGVEGRVSGRRNGLIRMRLDEMTEAWVAAEETRWLPETTRPRRARVGTVSIQTLEDRLAVDLSVSEPVPYQVEEDGDRISLILYGVFADTDWLRYGATDEFLSAARWEQDTGDRYVLHLQLAAQPWGYRVRYRPGGMVLEVRKPPRIDADEPLAGRLIAVDPGHPPAGATGPTRLYEGDANLAIALKLKEMLEEEGAEVMLTRSDRGSVRLYDRTRMAERAGAEVLVSIHNNALPDGVNPYASNGTSVFYFHPHSLDLAVALQRALLGSLGLGDLGIGRASLALVRPTWMPAALTEGAFMMIPAQEAALRDPDFQEAYARGVLDGIRAFLTKRAR